MKSFSQESLEFLTQKLLVIVILLESTFVMERTINTLKIVVIGGLLICLDACKEAIQPAEKTPNSGGAMSTQLGDVPLDFTFETFVSATPSSIVVASDVGSKIERHSADLTIQGVSDSGFTVTARAELTANSNWVVSLVTISQLPNGFSVPEFLVDTIQTIGFTSKNLMIKNDGVKEYKIHWRITGRGTNFVVPALLPRVLNRPWVGEHHALVIKGRNAEAIPAGAALYPYGQDEVNLISNLDGLGNAIGKMSNNSAKFLYTVEDSYYRSSNDSATSCNANEMITGLIRSTGITPENYLSDPFDFSIVTMYDQMVKSFTPICTGLSGYNSVPECPECERALFMPRLAYDPINAVLPHEYGHGLGLIHPEINYYCAEATPNNARETELFGTCAKRTISPADIMGGNLSFFSYSAVDRAALGWLKGSQVKTVVDSGIYDVYSDNDDRTSDVQKPLILQVMVRVAGGVDYIYVVVPNLNSSDPNIGLVNLNDRRIYGQYYTDSISLLTMASGRMGLGKVGLIPLYFSFENTIDSYDSVYKSPIPMGKSVHIQLTHTDVTIKNLSRDGHYARVEVVYHKKGT